METLLYLKHKTFGCYYSKILATRKEQDTGKSHKAFWVKMDVEKGRKHTRKEDCLQLRQGALESSPLSPPESQGYNLPQK